MNKVLECLKETRKLVQQGWTQFCCARDALNETTGPSNPKAVKWCLFGAVARASFIVNGPNSLFHEGYSLRNKTTAVLDNIVIATTMAHEIVTWNDGPNRTQEEVIQVIDMAIEKVANEQAC